MPNVDFTAILAVLVRHGVEFVVVGGVAAVLDGAPLNTFDLDVVHATDSENVTRLLAALDSLQARYRVRPELRPQASHLESPGHQLLMTGCGPLDLLGHIGHGWTYPDLLPHSVAMEISPGVQARVLDLATLITVKEEVADEKDRAALPILRRTLLEKSRPPTGN